MARRIRPFDEIRLNIVEAVKRANIQRGIIPGPPKPNKPSKKSPGIRPTEKPNQSSAEADAGADGSEQLLDLAEKSHDVLYEATTVFPFTLFPDSIILDREKLTIALRSFFRVAKIISVPVGAMLSAEADVGPFFGSVHMTSKYFVQNPYTVRFLSRNDATNIQRLLQGYIIAHERKVDCSSLGKNELVTLLEDLGKGASD